MDQEATSRGRRLRRLAPLGANARGKNEAFPALRPVPADKCTSPQGRLRTMRVRLRGYSSAPTFRVHSPHAGSFGYRHALRVPTRDALSFVYTSFSQTPAPINLGYVDLGHVDLMVQEGF